MDLIESKDIQLYKYNNSLLGLSYIYIYIYICSLTLRGLWTMDLKVLLRPMRVIKI